MSTITFTFTYSLFSSSLWRPGKIVKSIQKWLLEQSSPKWPVNFPAQKEPVKCLTKRVFMASASWAISRRARDRGKKRTLSTIHRIYPPQARMPLYISRVCDSYKILKKTLHLPPRIGILGPGGGKVSQLYIPRYLVVVPNGLILIFSSRKP